ncbi:hypothetical protein [Arthrobacter sp. Br18]|uniref:hypothetical protein n=1 Tax=Arthrobacter sp. Br18 TaxID=1312954 RepID=UPI00156676EE|nr:hypothetical protein [Arthrobacter sp. Br18]
MSTPAPSSRLVLADAHVAADFRTFTARARANDDGAIRLQASGPVLAAYVCTLRALTLGESTPTVLGLRTMLLAEPASVDTTVGLGSVADRLAHLKDDGVFPVPTVTVTESWAGVLPPRAGWVRAGAVPPGLLEEAAHNGIREVAALVPDRAGAPVVATARGAVWGRPLRGLPVELASGAAFGALSLGFLVAAEAPLLFTNGRWIRLSTSRGHILVRAAAIL